MQPNSIAATLLAITSAGAASAGGVELDIIGTMNAELDGEPAERVMLEGEFQGDAGGSANLTKMEMPHTTLWEITLQGHDPESDDILSEGVVIVSAHIGDAGDPAELSGGTFAGEVSYLEQNGMRPEIIYMTEEGEVTIESLEVDGERGHVRGSASGHGCRVDMTDIMAGADEEDCMQIEAEFDSEVVLDTLDIDL